MAPASLMVRLAPNVANDALLLFTADLAARLKVTKIIGIAACQPLQVYGSLDTYVPQDLIDRDRAQIESELKAAEGRFRTVLQGKVTDLEWRSTVTYGSLADYIAQQMRAADLLVTMPEEGGSLLDTSRQVDLADLVLRAGRPVLVVSAAVDKLDLRSVVVGWKDSREARRALEDALPLLKLADRATVVEIASGEDVPEARARIEDVADWLARHGVAASARAVASLGDDTAQLSSVAAELDAGLVVGGAYGHTRLREWVLGGVTRNLLLRPARASFLSH
ncbi:MAG: universal stress protein [Reyranella sp.]|uniref:universal stress protein n=1 Tax=Reyranella sp. TaxID=1929291 RepID=UPI00272F8565|nr:universal stress protein [Reyranella sp.]MDP1965981.1 universal stress protein [Reyranella sp.]MDP2374355.1 universal stress protein [Reyranella sp.]